MMGGVSQISGETTMRSRVTLPAGFDDILTRKRRFGLISRKNIMRAVAIIAFGRRGITELIHLPMICIKIGLGYIDMTAAALINNGQLKPF